MRGPRLFRNVTLMVVLGILSTRPVLANCDAAQESCSSNCSSMATSGFIMGMAGALNRNNNAYQSGQRDMQNAQACYNRCQTQYQSCSLQEQAAQQRQEAQRRAQQQREEAERQAQQRALAEREALRQRVNRVISPPVLPAPKIKDAAPLLLEAQAHDKDSNPAAAAYIYELVLRGAEQPRHQQAARAALRRHALEKLADVGTRKPSAYAMTLDAYGPLGVFSATERAQLAAMSPGADRPENAAREYLGKNPKGTLREVAQAVLTAAPGWRKQLAEEQKRREEEEEEKRLQQIRTAPNGKQVWVRTKEGCRIFDYIPQETLDVTWDGHCQDGLASGPGSYQRLGANGVTLFQYEGSLLAGRMDGFAKVDFGINGIYEGDFRDGKLHGRGKYLWKEGKRYEGDFRDNAMAGHGTLWETSGKYFQGEFVDNAPMHGTVYGPDGKALWNIVNGESRAR